MGKELLLLCFEVWQEEDRGVFITYTEISSHGGQYSSYPEVHQSDIQIGISANPGLLDESAIGYTSLSVCEHSDFHLL